MGGGEKLGPWGRGLRGLLGFFLCCIPITSTCAAVYFSRAVPPLQRPRAVLLSNPHQALHAEDKTCFLCDWAV